MYKKMYIVGEQNCILKKTNLYTEPDFHLLLVRLGIQKTRAQTLSPLQGAKASYEVGLKQGVTKRCRLFWLSNSALVYEPKCEGGGGGFLVGKTQK